MQAPHQNDEHGRFATEVIQTDYPIAVHCGQGESWCVIASL
jgi:hypothetical protein